MGIMIVTNSILDRVKEMPLLSVVASRLLELTGDDDHSLQDVAKIVENDAYLTTRVLRVVNSAVFSPIEPITTVSKAIVYLGEKTVMGIAIGSCSAAVFKKPLNGYEAAAGALWEHSLRTAIASREISIFVKEKISSNLAFTAGLLHDIGKSVISEFLDGNVNQMVNMCDEGKVEDFLSAEKNTVGTDHAEIGYELATHWRLPEPLVMVIKYHHHPNLCDGEYGALVYTVHLGDILAMMGGTGTGADSLSYTIDEKYSEFIDISKDHLAIVLLKIQEEFARARESILGSEEA